MKRSDKILLGAFLLGVFILIGTQAALYSKYKRGKFSLVTDNLMQSLVNIPIQDVAYISVDHIGPVQIKPADSTSLQWQKESVTDSSVQFKRVGDTLFVLRKDDGIDRRGLYAGLTLNLSRPMVLALKSSRLHVYGKNNILFPDLRVIADSTMLDFSSNSLSDGTTRRNNLGDIETARLYGQIPFKKLDITAINHSKINLFNFRINNLQVNLRSSSLDEEAAIIDNLQLTSDTASKISLRVINLSKAKINITHD